MGIELAVLATIVASHFVADFVVQAGWIAERKSSDHGVLLLHVVQYGLSILILCGAGFLALERNMEMFVEWTFLNVALHFCVDAITSRTAKWAKKSGKEKLFWIVIGFDQLAHQICLFGTYILLGLN